MARMQAGSEEPRSPGGARSVVTWGRVTRNAVGMVSREDATQRREGRVARDSSPQSSQGSIERWNAEAGDRNGFTRSRGVRGGVEEGGRWVDENGNRRCGVMDVPWAWQRMPSPTEGGMARRIQGRLPAGVIGKLQMEWQQGARGNLRCQVCVPSSYPIFSTP